MGNVNNFPQMQPPAVSKEEFRQTVENIVELRKLPEIDSNNPDMLNERIEYYFKYCLDKAIRPTLTGLAAALGVRRETLWKWEHKGGARGKTISRVKGVFEALAEEWLTAGKVNPAAGIFVLKNHFGWRDNLEITTGRNDTVEPLPSIEDITKKLPKNIPIEENTDGDFIDLSGDF